MTFSSIMASKMTSEYEIVSLDTLIEQSIKKNNLDSLAQDIMALNVVHYKTNNIEKQKSIDFLYQECSDFLHNKSIKGEATGLSRTFFIRNRKTGELCFFFTLGLATNNLENLTRKERHLVLGEYKKHKNRNVPTIILGQFAKLVTNDNLSGMDAFNHVKYQIEEGRKSFGGTLLTLDTTQILYDSFYSKIDSSWRSMKVKDKDIKSYDLQLYIVNIAKW
jgi:hypothetical protein